MIRIYKDSKTDQAESAIVGYEDMEAATDAVTRFNG
jgi:hypothetical protein